MYSQWTPSQYLSDNEQNNTKVRNANIHKQTTKCLFRSANWKARLKFRMQKREFQMSDEKKVKTMMFNARSIINKFPELEMLVH